MLSLASTPFAGSSRLECYRESFVNDQSLIPPFDETNAFEGTDPTSKYMFVFFVFQISCFVCKYMYLYISTLYAYIAAAIYIYTIYIYIYIFMHI